MAPLKVSDQVKARVGEGPTDTLLPKASKTFGIVVLVLQLVLLVAFALLAAAPVAADSNAPAPASPQLYNYYIGVTLMMFVGFGYLMTFLRWYGLGAVGLTMFVTTLGVEVSLLVEPLLGGTDVTIGILALLRANFAVAAFLISFGGLIGKVNPTQLVVLVVLESVFYCFNKQILMTAWLGIADVGGTIVIHMFGAYFGLAIALVLGAPKSTPLEKSSVTSDIFSLIGTTFLWLYWPSFVAGEVAPGSAEAELALTQTVLSLCASTVVTFGLSPLLSGGKIRPVDVQNATLAGGVAIGAVANLPLGPAGALTIGAVAGAVSTVGFCRIQEFLAAKVGLHDTCGIHNLHGMPSLVGGLASVVCGLVITSPAVGSPLNQLAGIVVTLMAAVLSGGLTGVAMKALADAAEMADDSAYWDVADDFTKDV
tara:strand:+ start:122 stop:1396 length:1275 start_codon:yes stop_codon:yes gene_type:complete